VAGVGDCNADGYDDILVGATDFPVGGAAFLYLGAASGLSASEALVLTPGQGGAAFGNGLGGAGDVNGMKLRTQAVIQLPGMHTTRTQAIYAPLGE
jgi:hypothetical protein